MIGITSLWIDKNQDYFNGGRSKVKQGDIAKGHIQPPEMN